MGLEINIFTSNRETVLQMGECGIEKGTYSTMKRFCYFMGGVGPSVGPVWELDPWVGLG